MPGGAGPTEVQRRVWATGQADLCRWNESGRTTWTSVKVPWIDQGAARAESENEVAECSVVVMEVECVDVQSIDVALWIHQSSNDGDGRPGTEK